MKIAFFTTCLEPGRDGVGDYTRSLAGECERMKCETRLLALRDPFAGAQIDPRILRVRDITASGDDARAARDFLTDFDPDWVSLQFVCYGFHARGLCWRAADALADLIGARRVHVMFHELWIGEEHGASLKTRGMGWLQRLCVMRILRALNVRRVHTSNPAYAALLRGRGIEAGVLPLFGSVPLSDLKPREVRTPPLRLLMFGTLHPVWPPEPLFTHLRALGVPLEIVHAGRIGSGAALWERMTRDYADVFNFQQLGELTPENLAKAFAEADFGIATTPWENIGKSASTAAMIEHGLPVIVNRDDSHYPGWREENYSPQLIKMGPDLARVLLETKRVPPSFRLPHVAADFIASLAGTAPRPRDSTKS